MTKIGIPALGLFVLWLLLSGHYTTLVISLGAASSIGVCVLANRLGVLTPEARSFRFLWQLVRYVPWLAREIVTSNVAVARAIWHPRLPIRPQVIRVEASPRTPLGLAALANSITMTPGTLSMDADREGEILVHAFMDQTAESLLSGDMNRRVCELEVVSR